MGKRYRLNGGVAYRGLGNVPGGYGTGGSVMQIGYRGWGWGTGGWVPYLGVTVPGRSVLRMGYRTGYRVLGAPYQARVPYWDGLLYRVRGTGGTVLGVEYRT